MKKITSLFLCISIICALIISVPAFSESLDSASSYSIGSTQSGSITETNPESAYRFTLNSSGRITVQYNAENMSYSRLKLYDSTGQEIWSDLPYWDSNSKQISFNEDIELTNGTYYFMVAESSGYGSYSFKIDFRTADETFEEVQGGSNNSLSEADSINLGETYKGQIALNDETDIYEFTLNSSGRITLQYNAENMSYSRLKLYDSTGQEIWSDLPYWDSNSKQISFNEDIELTDGTYYFMVAESSGYGSYSFKIDFKTADETFEEVQGGSNNSLSEADSINLGETYKGQIALNDETDIYEFTLNSSGRITLQYNAENMSYSRLKLYDSAGQEIWSDLPYWDSNSKQISFNEDIELTDGTYYFMVAESSGYGSYSFTLSNASSSTVSDNSNNNNEFETSTQPPTSTPRPTNTPRPASSDDNETSFGSSVSDWAKEEVETAYDNNLIPETIIGDDLTQNIDRTEFAAIAVQLYEELTGSYVYTGGTPFTDIARNDNYVSICKAYDLNITNGVTASTFDPHANITREDLATMLCRTIKKYSDPNWSLENDSEYYLDTSGVKKFADDDDISDYAKPSVYYMAKYGIVKGVDDTHFAPKNTNAWQEAIGYATATREQAILMSLRIYNASDIWG